MLLFNLCGYQLLHVYLEDRATDKLQIKLDINNYDESELISIKVPAEHLPYYNNSIQFEPVKGQIEICGSSYSYVKRRLYNDSIEMLCIPNQGATDVKKFQNEFFKLVNDLKHPGEQGKKTNSHSSNNPSADFYAIHDSFKIENLVSGTRKKAVYFSEVLPDRFLFTDERPPEMKA